MPQTLLDRFQYDLPQSVLDVLPGPHLANPIALGIHVIHSILLAPLFPGHNEVGSVLRSAGREKGRWERFEDEHTVRGRSMASGWTVRHTFDSEVVDEENGTEGVGGDHHSVGPHPGIG